MLVSGELAGISPVTIIVVILLISMLFFLTPEAMSNKVHYDFNVGRVPEILLIGSVHGNEPAGCAVLMDLIQSGYFNDKPGIRVIPCANAWGLRHGVRYQPNLTCPDINRGFVGEGSDDTTREILDLVKGARLVIDLHEGYDFHRRNPASIGSTVSPTPDITGPAEQAVQRINAGIRDPVKRWQVLHGISCDISGTLACYCLRAGISHILVETTGQNDIQPLELRKQQMFTIIDTMIRT